MQTFLTNKDLQNHEDEWEQYDNDSSVMVHGVLVKRDDYTRHFLGYTHPTRCRLLIQELSKVRFICPCEAYNIIFWYSGRHQYSLWDIIRFGFEKKDPILTYGIHTAPKTDLTLIPYPISFIMLRGYDEVFEQKAKDYCYRCGAKVRLPPKDCDFCGRPRLDAIKCKKANQGTLFIQNINDNTNITLTKSDVESFNSHKYCDEITGWLRSKAGKGRITRKENNLFDNMDKEEKTSYITSKFLSYIAEQRRKKWKKNLKTQK